jgi:hypothetical protein
MIEDKDVILSPWSFDKNVKPQKFFERFLDNDLSYTAERLKIEYERIANAEMIGVTPQDPDNDIFVYTKSVSTQKSREYNAFQMYYPFMHDLLSAVTDMTREACKYYEIDYNSEQWMAQAWFNINSREKGGKLDWHDHLDPNITVPAFHGYYSVNAEPSETHYNINGTNVINVNQNNRAILSMVGFEHAQAPWEWDGERITIAYDVVPLKIMEQEAYLSSKYIKPEERFWEQHYFPLPKIYDQAS